LQMVNVLVSVFSMTTIAVDRWQFIVHSGRARIQKLCLVTFLAAIWLVAFLISLPLFLIQEERVYIVYPSGEKLQCICEETWSSNLSKYVYSLFLVLFQYILPAFIIGFTNYEICRFLRFNMPVIYAKRNNQDEKTTDYSIDILSTLSNPKRALLNLARGNACWDGMVTRRNKRYTRSRRILLLVFLIFSVCWVPSVVLNVMLDFSLITKEHMKEDTMTVLLLTLQLIAISSTCLNPILYGLLNKNFNHELSRIISQKFSSSQKKTSNSNGAQSDKNVSKEKNHHQANISNSGNSLLVNNS
jgi:hypothetical protein